MSPYVTTTEWAIYSDQSGRPPPAGWAGLKHCGEQIRTIGDIFNGRVANFPPITGRRRRACIVHRASGGSHAGRDSTFQPCSCGAETFYTIVLPADAPASNGLEDLTVLTPAIPTSHCYSGGRVLLSYIHRSLRVHCSVTERIHA